MYFDYFLRFLLTSGSLSGSRSMSTKSVGGPAASTTSSLLDKAAPSSNMGNLSDSFVKTGTQAQSFRLLSSSEIGPPLPTQTVCCGCFIAVVCCRPTRVFEAWDSTSITQAHSQKDEERQGGPVTLTSRALFTHLPPCYNTTVCILLSPPRYTCIYIFIASTSPSRPAGEPP